MQVTAIELEGVEGHESIMYDITLCELDDWVARASVRGSDKSLKSLQ